MDLSKELWILIGVGGVFTLLILYYVIKLERTIVRILIREEKRKKREKEIMEEAKKLWGGKH